MSIAFTLKRISELCFLCLYIGIVFRRYDARFRNVHKLYLSIMKRFGFGQRMMETRILMEVEEMINKVREKKGHPFDVTPLATSCVTNVIMSMLFAYRFDHSDPAFQQLISDMHYLTANFSIALHLFPALRFLPYFKKSTAKKIEAINGFLNFVDSNVAAGKQVWKLCSFFMFYFYIKNHS